MSITGLRVTKAPGAYPFALSTSEIAAHKHNVLDYQSELSKNLYLKATTRRPELNLIVQQPELTISLRRSCLEFLLKLSIKVKVAPGVFHQAVRIFDRYSSKRIVLKSQLQLVLGTCLWLTAKTYGGCNHVINNTNISTGGRFKGPTVRARIPRLAELVAMCDQTGQPVDTSMFAQMERHILNTLEWDVVDPKISNWLFEFYELNMPQLEQLPDVERNSFKDKIEIIQLKQMLADLSPFEISLVELHPEELTQVIFHILEQYILATTGAHCRLHSELTFQNYLTPEALRAYSTTILTRIFHLFQTSQFLYTQYVLLSSSSRFYGFLQSTFVPTASTLNTAAARAATQHYTHISNPSIYKTPNSTASSLQLTYSLPAPPPVQNGLATPTNSRRSSPTGAKVGSMISSIKMPQSKAERLPYSSPMTS